MGLILILIFFESESTESEKIILILKSAVGEELKSAIKGNGDHKSTPIYLEIIILKSVIVILKSVLGFLKKFT